MREVVIAGLGMTPVGEHWDISMRSLAYRAMKAALLDAGGIKPQALYVGNFLGSVLSHQANLGALLVDNAGLDGIEAITVEAAEASGAGAFRVGYLAVASGLVDTALVVGVEKYTDSIGGDVEAAAAQSMDYEYEGMQGMTLSAQAGLLMRRYLYDYHVPRSALGGIPVLSHTNAVHNSNAIFRKKITAEMYEKAEIVADPLNLFDIAPYADGAAALVLTARECLPENIHHLPVRITGSSVSIDTLAIHDRPDPLAFNAARFAVESACSQAGILPGDASLFELYDAFSIYGVLCLEAAGFARRGEGWQLAQSGDLALSGKLPVNTMGGLKGRGNPLGATGVYQLAEAALQIRGQAGAGQVVNARRALVLTLGGPASTAIAHVLEK